MVTLTDISIENYRGFYERRNIKPAIPNGTNGSGLTILVGPNNSGKSTVVSAMRLVTGNARQIDLEHRHPDEQIKITLTNSEGGQKAITNPDKGAVTVFEGQKNSYPNSANIRLVPSRRAWTAYSGNPEMAPEGYWDHAKEGVADDNLLVSRLAYLSGADRNNYNRLLKELLPELSSWRIELSRGQTFVLYTTKSGALLAGRVQLMFSPATAVLPHIQSGALKGLAVSSGKRYSAAPSLATLRDAGVDLDASLWFAIWAPAGTPQAVIDALSRTGNVAIKGEVAQKLFATQGFDALGGTPADFAKLQADELAKWKSAVEAAGLKK